MPIGYNHVALVGRIVETPLYKNFGDNKMMIFLSQSQILKSLIKLILYLV